jgi:CDP-4-dehydro-6-deoxyglucose reductase, E1
LGLFKVNKLDQILTLISEYITEQQDVEWKPGEDWIAYSGPVYNDKEYVAAVKSLLGQWLIFGQDARKFELEFPQHLGKKFGSLTNSGSSANLLMVAALKSQNWLNLSDGAKIITPIVCFPTTLNPILQNGFEPVFVDVTLPDLNLDLNEVERLLENDTSREIKAIMFAHVLGNPPDLDRLMKLVTKYDLIFLEDACDALGSTYDGKKLGSFGDISTCSFFPAHHMTMGEGGFVATDNYKIRKIVASMRDWGRACYCNTSKPGSVLEGTACGNRFKNWLPEAKEVIYDHRYVFDEIGYNLKPLELQAAMGLQQLDKLDFLDEARRKNWSRLKDIFAPYHNHFHLPEATEKSDPCWFAFLLTVRDDAPFNKRDIIEHLEAAKIQTRSYFAGNILYHPGYNHLAAIQENMKDTYPIAHKVTTSSFFLGTFAGITDEKLDYIEQTVNDFMGGY